MIDLPVDQDAVRKYLCDDAPDARLMTVKLGQSTDDMLDHQQMPAPIKALCAELVAATCVLAHMLKFDGEMIVQIKGAGPVTMMVAECSSEGRIRATAQWDDIDHYTTFSELIG